MRFLRYFSKSAIAFNKIIKEKTVKNVLVVTLDTPNSKVNVLNKALQGEIKHIQAKFQEDKSLKAMVLMSAKPDCFVAGADISMLSAAKTAVEATALSKSGQDQMNEIEKSDKPIVAAIMGSCLGGGMELAMACHYRIAVDTPKTVLGLPEVKLGLLPGAGGTQRLVRRMARFDEALTMMLTGANNNVSKAKRLGLVDLVVKPLGPGIKSPQENTMEYLEKVAIDIALDVADKKIKREPVKKNAIAKIMASLLQYSTFQNFFFNYTNKQLHKKTAGLYPAPEKIIDVVRKSLGKSLEEGLALEAEAFGQLAMTQESKALMGLFAGHTECRKGHSEKGVAVEKVGVLGAGLMGAGIAQVTIQKAGLECVLKDVSDGGLASGLEQIQKNLSQQVKRKRMLALQKDRLIARLLPTTVSQDLAECQLIIEAVFEDFALKHRVLGEIEGIVGPKCIIASNTSALPIHKIAEGCKNPERVVGMHYFSPVDKMELLEVISATKTSAEARATAINVGLKQGKVIISVKDGPGFYTTRILAPMLSECVLLIQEGVGPRELDAATKALGWPVGIATLADEVGLDVAMHVAQDLGAAFGERFRGGDPKLIVKMVEAGMLGRKSGKGMYLYGEAKHRQENPELGAILEPFRRTGLIEASTEHIQQRLFCRFVNEAVLCLQEGILAGPIDGDIGAVFGLGFPPFLGGPFRFLDLKGADAFVARMERYAALYGNQFAPCQLLRDHAKDASLKFHKQ